MAPPPTTPWITEAQLGLHLRRDLTGDDLATLCVEGACDSIRAATDQFINGVVDDTITIDGPGTDTLLLPQLPVTDVTAVKITYTDGITAPTDVSAKSYYARLDHGALYFIHSYTTLRRGAYQITYSHGYNTEASGTDTLPPVPKILVALALQIAARLYDQGIAAQETVGGYQTIFGTPTALSLSPIEMLLLKRFNAGRK